MLNNIIRLLACSIVFAMLLLITRTTAAQTPSVFNYQGRLLQNTAAQAPVSGTVDIVFSIWSGPASDAGATQLWTESWSGVGLSNGIFSVLLGSNGTPLDPANFQNDTTLYLQLEIDGETLLPRQQLGAVPFAIVDEPENEYQDLSLNNDTLELSDSAATVDLSAYLDNTDNQQLSLSGSNLQLTSDDGTDTVDLSVIDTDTNTDNQQLSLSGSNLQLTSDDGTDIVDLSVIDTNTDAQTLSLSGNNLSISGSGSSVSLASFLDNTDNQNLNSVLANGSDANNRDITNVDDFDANDITASTLDCPNCVDTADIANDTIGGNDITDRIFILHIDCNGSCADMSMREACDVIENLRNLDFEVELMDVSCVHGVPSTTGNQFVACDDGTEVHGDNECRAFELRTLGDIPCVNGDGTDALVTCYRTDIAK